MTNENKRPFAPHYAVTAEYLFDLARWFAEQEKLPKVEDMPGDFRYMHEVDAFRERVFAFMVGSEVTIKPSYWLTDLKGENAIKLDGDFSLSVQQAIDYSKNEEGNAFKLIKQYVHTLKTITERVGIVFDGEVYYQR